MTIDPETLLLARADQRRRCDPWHLMLLRVGAGLSQPELAQRMGYKPPSGAQAICRIENYEIGCGLTRLHKFAKALRCQIDDLLSAGDVWQANRDKRQTWLEAGKPPLASWLAARMATDVIIG